MEKLYQLKEMLEEKKYWVIGGIIVFLFLITGIYLSYHFIIKKEEPVVEIESILVDKQEEKKEELEKENSCFVIVDIKGQVNQPGLYELECGSRVHDVILLAGNVTKDADTRVLNLSKKVFDEMVIIVYSKEETKNFIKTKEEEKEKQQACQNNAEVKNDACVTEKDTNGKEDKNSSNDTGQDSSKKEEQEKTILVSINTATKEELMEVPGIGASKADSIIAYRNEHGNFQTLEDIKNVSGIGDTLFEKIKPYITL